MSPELAFFIAGILVIFAVGAGIMGYALLVSASKEAVPPKEPVPECFLCGTQEDLRPSVKIYSKQLYECSSCTTNAAKWMYGE